ncbi:MAG TPA: M6 family metalloprotease domain-containing protein [archaeon]|nr:M6 family metalloprotease domain-containing protein [archaeon]
MGYFQKIAPAFLCCCFICLGTGLSAELRQDSIPIAFSSIQYPVVSQGTGLRHGDPGWVRKMARRKQLRRKAGRKEAALQALQPDKFYLPVLLGSFSDRDESHSVEDFQDLLFDNNPSGTMTGYFSENSYGQLLLTGKVYGWLQVDHPVDYYAATAWDANSFPQNIAGFVTEIVTEADPVVDFSFYDNDGPDGVPNSGDDDGYVDAVMIVYAGVYGENSLPVAGLQGALGGLGSQTYTTGDPSSNGGSVKIRVFTLVPELLQDSIFPIGVACHEFCHVLGLPDLYDHTLNSVGLGYWCIMSFGNNPPGGKPTHLSAWCKMQLGWVTPVEVNEDKTINLDPVETNSKVYMIWEDGYRLSRYFLLENRQRTGFDTGLPGSGMLIYHVDENKWFGKPSFFRGGSQNNDFTHKLVDLEEADGKCDLDYSRNPGDAGDPFPGLSNNRTFDDLSNPDTKDYDGNSTGVAVTNISYSNWPAMQADITVRTPLGYAIVYDHNGITGYGWDVGSWWGGVLFKAGKHGILAALDLGFPYPVEEYEIKIYRTITDSVPSGLIHTVSGETATPGWHTINLINKKIIVEEDQEFLVTYRSNSGIWYDPYSEYTGRSYFSDSGRYFSPLPGREYGNFNLRARINTADYLENIVLCDFNADGNMDNEDVIALLKYLHENPGDPKADFNRDGKANILDAIAMLRAQHTGACPDR